MKDYLDIEYNVIDKPLTDYPAKLAKYLFDKFELTPGMTMLEIGCGRCELLAHFKDFGLQTYGLDSAESAAKYAELADSHFELAEFKPNENKIVFNDKKFDLIFSKSFIEHVSDPKAYLDWCYSLLVDGGRVITLTPDFEVNFKVFYDDYTHVKPFTKVSLHQVLVASNFEKVSVFKFRQLPSTWNSKLMNLISAITSIFSSHRAKNKWLRWSRELMLASVGTKSMQSD
jgi:cyclopropane fatty-acyl-phospholipid synthase-like methyltransferase